MTTPNQAVGALILVVGPSGAGKDSLIHFAGKRLARNPVYVFPRRYITRAQDAGGEDHIEVSLGQFEALLAADQFALHWNAHGMRYGLPASIVGSIEQGCIVIANVSRTVIPEAAQRFGRVFAVSITVRPEVLRRRLIERGREKAADIDNRLSRAQLAMGDHAPIYPIDNSGALETSGGAFVTLIRYLASQRPPNANRSAISNGASLSA